LILAWLDVAEASAVAFAAMSVTAATAGPPPVPPPALEEAQRLYLDLLKKCLTRFITGGEGWRPYEPRRGTLARTLYAPVAALLRRLGMRLVRPVPFDPAQREAGVDWPAEAETMVGLRRLDNLEVLIADVVRRDVPGDLVETGVWRGGASIFMRGVLAALEDTSRRVWACDSFAGLPPPDPERFQADAGDALWTFAELRVSLEEVKANFARYGLLDEQVRFLPGWFRQTLPTAPIERVSLLRLDGDMYESTHDALEALYPRLSAGGYLVVDDYGAVPACRQAVADFRTRYNIDETIHEIDWTGVYWRRSG
jgi:O-methyltransferase